MANARATEAVRRLTENGAGFDYGAARSRLMLAVIRALAEGHPLSPERTSEIAAGLGIEQGEADSFLRQTTERDANDNLVGLVLTLNESAHRFNVNGIQMWAWCAEDTLFLPAYVHRTAIVESRSPVSGASIRLRISPERIEEASPPGTVVSFPIVDSSKADTSSLGAIWSNFCHRIFFFPSRGEAERWAAGQDDIEILSLDEGFELGRLIAKRWLSHE